MKNVIKFLKSESFIFVAILFVTAGQILHTIHLFQGLRRMDLSFSYGNLQVSAFNWIHAFVCATAIESAILISILNGKKRVAQVYAVGSFATNLLYYSYWFGTINEIVSSCLMSAMLSGSIWFFSDIFAQKVNGKWELDEKLETVDDLSDALTKLSGAVSKLEEESTAIIRKTDKPLLSQVPSPESGS